MQASLTVLISKRVEAVQTWRAALLLTTECPTRRFTVHLCARPRTQLSCDRSLDLELNPSASLNALSQPQQGTLQDPLLNPVP